MRILTVRQPWAWAIIHGGKDVENRVRSLGAYRGLVAIHAGLSWAGASAYLLSLATPALHDALKVVGALDDADAFERLEQTMIQQRGHVIGVVDLGHGHRDEDCYDLSIRLLTDLYHRDPEAFRAFPDNGAGGVVGRARMCSPWAQENAYHLTLSDPRPLARPIPAKGRLGLWRPDADLETAIREQIGEA